MVNALFKRLLSSINEVGGFIRGHPFLVLFGVFLGISGRYVAGIFAPVLVASTFNLFLQVLIESEATVFCFFVLIALFTLSILGKRIDRLRQLTTDMDIEVPQKSGQLSETLLTRGGALDRQLVLEEAKRRFRNSAKWVGFLLALSVALSVVAWGFWGVLSQLEATLFLCWLSVELFVLGSVSFLVVIYKLARKTKLKSQLT